MNKYMLIYRHPVSQEKAQPSPEEMQQMLKQWEDWKEEFKANILDMGDGLKPEGRVLSSENDVMDGPFIEAKEVLAGYSVISADNFDQALDVSRTCPFRNMPGYSIEIRELACY